MIQDNNGNLIEFVYEFINEIDPNSCALHHKLITRRTGEIFSSIVREIIVVHTSGETLMLEVGMVVDRQCETLRPVSDRHRYESRRWRRCRKG